METWNKYLPFLAFCFVVTSNAFITNTIVDYEFMKSLRVRRQSGYVYNKPNVSFNLPTQTITTRAPTVDRIPTQMYYAYPAPAQGNTATAVSSTGSGYNYNAQNTNIAQAGAVNVGYSNAGTTATGTSGSVSATGYNYVQPQGNTANVAISNVGPTATGTTVTSTSGSGYNYEQNIQISQPERNTAGITNTESSSGVVGSGYNYARQNTGSPQLESNVNVGYTGGATSGAIATSGTTATSGAAVSTSVGTGYNYDIQNTGVIVQPERADVNVGYSSPTTNAASSSGSSGYNYEKQNAVIAPQVTSYQQTEYDSARPNVEISTNAPRYLPPKKNENVAVTVNAGPVNIPSITYLQPETQIRTQTVTNEQTAIIESPNTGYIPPGQNVNLQGSTQKVVETIQTSTSLPVVQQPTRNYLPPKTQASNVHLTEPQRTYLTQPVQSQYVPPATSVTTKPSVSTLASTYLPPVL